MCLPLLSVSPMDGVNLVGFDIVDSQLVLRLVVSQ